MLDLQAIRVARFRPVQQTQSEYCLEEIVSAPEVEIIRLALPENDSYYPPHADGPLVVQCTDGCATVVVDEGHIALAAGELVYLPEGCHAVHGITPSSLVMFSMSHARDERRWEAEHEAAAFDAVDEASLESFPASDPPAHTPIEGIGPVPRREPHLGKWGAVPESDRTHRGREPFASGHRLKLYP